MVESKFWLKSVLVLPPKGGGGGGWNLLAISVTVEGMLRNSLLHLLEDLICSTHISKCLGILDSKTIVTILQMRKQSPQRICLSGHTAR